MLRGNSKILLGVHQLIDLLLITISFMVAYFAKIHLLPANLNGLTSDYDYNVTIFIALITFHTSLRLFGCYEQYRNLKLSEVISRVIKAAITGTAGIIFILYLSHMEGISRLLLAMFTSTSILFLAIFKTVLYKILTYNRKRNLNTRNILLIGCRQRAIDFIKSVKRTPESGYRIIGCVDTVDQKNTIGDIVHEDISVIGTLESYKDILEQVTVDEVVFGLPLKRIQDVHKYIYFAEAMGINVKIVPDFQIDKIKYLPSCAKTSLSSFMGMPTLSLSSLPTKDTELLIKNFIDYVGAGIGLVLASPLFLVISAILKMTSPGPVVFSQQRVGLNGRLFNIYKFRTMVANAEELKGQLAEKNEVDGPVFKIKKDPRITSIGQFLRKTSLDELPQLINVLKGEMSLVGPRPPIPDEVDKYKLWQRRRLSMKPGLTCIWQVSGRNDISFEQWMNMDLQYIDNWSLKLDVNLLAKTVKEVTFGGGR